jgi:hypothetical protein
MFIRKQRLYLSASIHFLLNPRSLLFRQRELLRRPSERKKHRCGEFCSLNAAALMLVPHQHHALPVDIMIIFLQTGAEI